MPTAIRGNQYDGVMFGQPRSAPISTPSPLPLAPSSSDHSPSPHGLSLTTAIERHSFVGKFDSSSDQLLPASSVADSYDLSIAADVSLPLFSHELIILFAALPSAIISRLHSICSPDALRLIKQVNMSPTMTGSLQTAISFHQRASHRVGLHRVTNSLQLIDLASLQDSTAQMASELVLCNHVSFLVSAQADSTAELSSAWSKLQASASSAFHIPADLPSCSFGTPSFQSLADLLTSLSENSPALSTSDTSLTCGINGHLHRCHAMVNRAQVQSLSIDVQFSINPVTHVHNQNLAGLALDCLSQRRYAESKWPRKKIFSGIFSIFKSFYVAGRCWLLIRDVQNFCVKQLHCLPPR
jgi:hypothetical protein